MATVPYSGVPTVAPGGAPTPRISYDTPPAAFGTNVAQAIEGLGRTADGVGNELYTRALAMQDLANHSEAQEADAKYMQQAGDLHAKYSTLQGKDAVDAYPKYIQDLQAARKSIRDGLSNQMSQKLYDSQSLSTMGRTIFNGAGHAATQNKQYAINANQAQIDNQTDLAATSSNPKDVEAARGRLKDLAREKSGLLGQDPASAEETARTINSSLDYNVVTHMARANPQAASDELEKRKDGMTAKDYDHARTIVDNQNRAVGSVNIAQRIINSHVGDDGKSDANYEQLQQEAEIAAKKQFPDDAVGQQHVVAALKGLYNQKVYADKQQRWENTQTVSEGIQSGVKDIQELRADPKMAAAIDNLPKHDQLKIPAQINAYNAARDKAANQESLTRIAGLRNNDVESFLNLDPTDPKLQLSQSQQREVMGWQAQDKKNQNGDPRVNRAMSWLRESRSGEMAALGIYRRDNKSPEDYDHFTGALSSALDLWREAHGKPAEFKDVVETIGPQLIQSRPVPGYLWGTNQQPFFKPDYNSDSYKLFSRKLTEDVVAKGGNEPTPEQIDRAYTAAQLKQLYTKPPKATTDGK